LKRLMLIGMVSEVLLVLGIVFALFDRPIFPFCIGGHCFNLYNPVYFVEIALLVASSIGFLFVLILAKGMLTTRSGTPN